ncbi:MAG: flagellar motor switch protein FliN [Planctomycetota bacterium]
MADEHPQSENTPTPSPDQQPAASASSAASPTPTDGAATPDAIDAMAEEAINAANDAVSQLQQETSSPGADGPVTMPEFANATATAEPEAIGMLGDVELRVKIELGRTIMYVEDVLRLNAQSIIELDKAAGDPVDIYVNDRHVARGEVLVLNDNFCVRVSEIIQHASPAKTA